MPLARCGRAAAGLALALALGAATARRRAAVRRALPTRRSTRALFYQLLVGELELRSGEPAPPTAGARCRAPHQGPQRCSSAPSRSRCRRAPASRRWRRRAPGATRCRSRPRPCATWLQILIALNRIDRDGRAARAVLAAAPAPGAPGADRLAAALLRPRHRAQAGRRGARAGAGPYVERAGDARCRRSSPSGRGWLAADDPPRALDAARSARTRSIRRRRRSGAARARADAVDAGRRGDRAASICRRARASAGMRLALCARCSPARSATPTPSPQLEAVTREQPALARALADLGALQLELQPVAGGRGRAAELRRSWSRPARPRTRSADEDDAPASRDEALTQAWLLLAQAAEQRGDFAAAERGWRRSTTRSARSTCRRAAPRCWRARAS